MNIITRPLFKKNTLLIIYYHYNIFYFFKWPYSFFLLDTPKQNIFLSISMHKNRIFYVLFSNYRHLKERSSGPAVCGILLYYSIPLLVQRVYCVPEIYTARTKRIDCDFILLLISYHIIDISIKHGIMTTTGHNKICHI